MVTESLPTPEEPAMMAPAKGPKGATSPETLMPGWESTPRPASQGKGASAPKPRKRNARAVEEKATPPHPAHPAQPDGPAPINAVPGEPLAHTRIRALQLAEYHKTIGLYIGIKDAAVTDPSRLQYYYLPAGMTLEDLRPGEEPPTLPADDVLAHCYGLGAAAGLAEVFAFRPGLPGWKAAKKRKPRS